MKIELKLATYLEMHNAEKKWWKCLTDPCPKLSSFWYACSHIWQCCWEPQRILRYLPIIVPSGHLKSAFIWYWSFSSCCLVTREAFQDAKPKFTSPLAQECFWFLYAVAIMCTSGKSPVGWSRDYLIRLVLHALCLNWMLLIILIFSFCCSSVTAKDYQATSAQLSNFPAAAYSGGLGTDDKNFGKECRWDYQHPSSCPKQPPQGPPSALKPV